MPRKVVIQAGRGVRLGAEPAAPGDGTGRGKESWNIAAPDRVQGTKTEKSQGNDSRRPSGGMLYFYPSLPEYTAGEDPHENQGLHGDCYLQGRPS